MDRSPETPDDPGDEGRPVEQPEPVGDQESSPPTASEEPSPPMASEPPAGEEPASPYGPPPPMGEEPPPSVGEEPTSPYGPPPPAGEPEGPNGPAPQVPPPAGSSPNPYGPPPPAGQAFAPSPEGTAAEPGRPGVGIGIATGCGLQVLGAVLFLATIGVIGSIWGLVWPFVLITVLAGALMFSRRWRRFATGVLIVSAASWLIVIGPCIGMMGGFWG